MSDARIFIQIAAYRDSELLATMRDCVTQAEHPEQLRFGICWQRAADETLAEFEHDPRVRLIEVPFERARGACWARQQTQSLYRDEPYTLQIDSHHRFAPGWDVLAIDSLESLRAAGHAKPLLTSYAPVYDPDNDPAGRKAAPLRLRFDGFTQDGPFAVMPETMDDWESLQGPEPARFFSAHLAFTLGAFCREVPYDPKLYFFGEEPSLALRAFTHGYDLFHPHRVIAWHFYGRERQPKHWADHRRWTFRNELSMQRFRRMIEEGRAGVAGSASALHPFGLGTQRSLQDYERFAGVSFSLLGASAHAMRALPPPEPGPLTDEASLHARIQRNWTVDVPLDGLHGVENADALEFLYVGAHSSHGEELLREDLRGDALRQALDAGHHVLRVNASAPPASWTLWPYHHVGGWGEKRSGTVPRP